MIGAITYLYKNTKNMTNTKNTKFYLILIAVLTLIVFLAVGCGNNVDDTTVPDQTEAVDNTDVVDDSPVVVVPDEEINDKDETNVNLNRKLYVSTGVVNVRSESSTDGNIIGQVTQVDDVWLGPTDQNLWAPVYIQFSDTEPYGYVYFKYFKEKYPQP